MTDPALSAIVFLVIKTCVLIGLGFYAIFAGVIVRQEQLMAAVLEESFEPVLRVVTLAHLLVAVGLFFFALILL